MGDHYLLNLYGCSSVCLNDEHFLIDLLENAAEASGAGVVETVFKKFSPQGVTVLTLLEESHISIHTWPEMGEAAAVIFTCGNCMPKIGVDIIVQQLNPKTHTLQRVSR